MAIIEAIEGCRVEWREGGHAPTPGVRRSGSNGVSRVLTAVEVRRTGADTFEFTRPRSGRVIVKRISGQHVSVIGPGGVDVLASWRGATLNCLHCGSRSADAMEIHYMSIGGDELAGHVCPCGVVFERMGEIVERIRERLLQPGRDLPRILESSDEFKAWCRRLDVTPR